MRSVVDLNFIMRGIPLVVLNKRAGSLSENRKCVTEEETSVHILCECESLASLRRTYLGSLLLEVIRVPSSWTQRTLGYQVWGPSGTLLKEQSFYNLVQNMGHKGPVLRCRCIGPGRARTQILFYSILFYSNWCVVRYLTQQQFTTTLFAVVEVEHTVTDVQFKN